MIDEIAKRSNFHYLTEFKKAKLKTSPRGNFEKKTLIIIVYIRQHKNKFNAATPRASLRPSLKNISDYYVKFS